MEQVPAQVFFSRWFRILAILQENICGLVGNLCGSCVVIRSKSSKSISYHLIHRKKRQGNHPLQRVWGIAAILLSPGCHD